MYFLIHMFFALLHLIYFFLDNSTSDNLSILVLFEERDNRETFKLIDSTFIQCFFFGGETEYLMAPHVKNNYIKNGA